MHPDVSVSRFVAASPDVIYTAITDVTRMGEWSPELYAAEWTDGHDRAALGARYIGHNRYRDNAWSIENEVVELVENERFAFDCYSSITGDVFARWGYVIAEAEGGCDVTEWMTDLRSDEAKARSAAKLGIADRAAHNRQGMEETLQRIASACERG